MKNYLDLTSISAKIHKKQHKMTIICIILSVSLVSVIFSMADMALRSQRLLEIKKSGNWHFLVIASAEYSKMISLHPEVVFAGQYAMADGDAYSLNGESAILVGTDETTLKNIFGMDMVEGSYPSTTKEIALSENAKTVLNISIGDIVSIALKSGTISSDTISTDDSLDFVVTGFGENTSHILKEDSYGLLVTTDTLHSFVPENHYRNRLFVQLSPYCNMKNVITEITEQYQLSDKQISQNAILLGLYGKSNNSYMSKLYEVAIILFVLILIASILMVTSSLNSNVAQRTKFFGMMRCIGATKKQIVRFVYLEALQWCKLAIPVGLALGIIVVWVLCAILRYSVPMLFAEMPVFGLSWTSIVFGLVVGVLTVIIAAQSPAKRAAKVSPLTAASGNTNQIQTVKKAVNTTCFTVDVALGIHHAVSNKKNFALMVGSFALSIILFLSFSVAIDFLNHALSPLRPSAPDISINSAGGTSTFDDTVMAQLQANSKVKRSYGRKIALDVPVMINGVKENINLISYEDNQFAWAKDVLLDGSLDDVKYGNGVFIVYDSKSALQIGDSIIFDVQNRSVMVSGILSYVSFPIHLTKVTVICSEKTFARLAGKTDYTAIDLQLAKDATDDDVTNIRSLVGSSAQFSDQRSINSEVKGAYYSGSLFIYGFLIVIALISVFNIMNSIAMSVLARIKQYGAMRAIGMSDFQLVKMITTEAITYAVAGSFIGCIIGLSLNKIIFESMITFKWGDSWTPPFNILSIVVVIVIVTAIFAVHSPSKRIRKMAVVDTINAE